MQPRTVDIDEFERACLAWVDGVAASGTPLTVLKDGLPYVQLLPIDRRPLSSFGALADVSTVVYDIVSPIEEAWDAQG